MAKKKYQYYRDNINHTDFTRTFLDRYCKRVNKKRASVLKKLLKDAINGVVVKTDGSNFFD